MKAVNPVRLRLVREVSGVEPKQLERQTNAMADIRRYIGEGREDRPRTFWPAPGVYSSDFRQ